jgi:hypothetical protein
MAKCRPISGMTIKYSRREKSALSMQLGASRL